MNPATSAPKEAPAAPSAVPQRRFDWLPFALLVVVMAAALPLVGSGSTWLTLTVAGLAMGMIVFVVSSGLTLVFGLMDVLNFGHGAFVAFGAYVAVSVLTQLDAWMQVDSLAVNLAACGLALLAAMAAAGVAGWLFERVMIRPVYGQHLKQILVTTGGMIMAEELIKAVWGAQPIPLASPAALRGVVLVGDAAIEKYRLLAIAFGLVVFAALGLTLGRTRIGLLIRAGVENREMVESLGYRVKRLFIGVFTAGAALAGAGGVLWGLYEQNLTASVGSQLNVLIFIVIIIGGLGSTVGCFVGALLVGLLANYTGFVAPPLALFSNIVLMLAILMWRPQGLYPLSRN